MGTVFPVDVVDVLQNRCAQLLEGLATRILGGCLGAGLSTGSLPWFVSMVRSRVLGLVTVGHWLQRGRCSGAAGRAQVASQ